MKQFPGPNALKIFEDAKKYYATTTCSSCIVVRSGEGAIVTDVDGFEFYDLHCDASVNNLGRNNELVRNAIEFQLDSGNFFSEHHNSPNPETVKLAKILTEKSPVPGPSKVFFSNSGAEANEAARKLCRAYRFRVGEKDRTKTVYFQNGFAGRTKGVLAGTSSKSENQRDPFWDHCDKENSIYVPYPSLYNFEESLSVFNKIDLSEVDRILIELSCQGEGGIIPCNGYAVSLMRQKAKDAGVFWIADAIQCGMGRDGSMFGCDNLFTGSVPAIEPDILVLGKALGGGLPIGATIFREDLDFKRSQHSNTFGGGPLVASSALTVFRQIENIVNSGSIKKIEGMLFGRLLGLWGKYTDVIMEPRGRGAMWAVEFFDTKSRDRVIEIAEEIVLEQGRGLRLLGAGKKSIRFMPPINISFEELENALEIFNSVIFKFKNNG
ncbi:MAG TPA: aminotransferase class III-fold pyridoxal phosphate-dependent enzyme [Candidatus Paceibacterota bacterium]